MGIKCFNLPKLVGWLTLEREGYHPWHWVKCTRCVCNHVLDGWIKQQHMLEFKS
jgi:hypothetical protein